MSNYGIETEQRPESRWACWTCDRKGPWEFTQAAAELGLTGHLLDRHPEALDLDPS